MRENIDNIDEFLMINEIHLLAVINVIPAIVSSILIINSMPIRQYFHHPKLVL